MLSLNEFSILMSLSSAWLFFCTLVIFVYSYTRRGTELLRSFGYMYIMIVIGTIASASVAGALFYQLYYMTQICELCWWQRIFMFPLPVIAAVGFWYKERSTHISLGILALLGTFYAAYHYYYHYRGLVLGQQVALPCSSGGLLPACTDSPILTFGFSTIPLMALFAFVSIVVWVCMAHRLRKI
jgi:disulfide bond formation protein DsbB